jgi:hypothetical protein
VLTPAIFLDLQQAGDPDGIDEFHAFKVEDEPSPGLAGKAGPDLVANRGYLLVGHHAGQAQHEDRVILPEHLRCERREHLWPAYARTLQQVRRKPQSTSGCRAADPGVT